MSSGWCQRLREGQYLLSKFIACVYYIKLAFSDRRNKSMKELIVEINYSCGLALNWISQISWKFGDLCCRRFDLNYDVLFRIKHHHFLYFWQINAHVINEFLEIFWKVNQLTNVNSNQLTKVRLSDMGYVTPCVNQN